MNRAIRMVLPVATGLVALATGLVDAAQFPLTDGELVRQSTVVVDARVARTTPHWNADRSIIFTTVEFDVVQTLHARGRQPSRTVRVEVPGGELGGIGMVVSECPDFRLGERVVVFIKPWKDGLMTVTGGEGGRFTVDANGIVQGRGVNVDGFRSRIRTLAP